MHHRPIVLRAALALASTLLTATLLTAACLGAAPPAPVSEPAVAAPLQRQAAELREQALADTLGWELVQRLTTEVGPRSAGSAGDRAAVAWALAELTALGFENVHAEPVTVPHWVRGEEEGEIVAPWPQPVRLTALGGSVGTPEEGIEAEVVQVGTVEELEALPEGAVAGRIVFFDAAMERQRSGAGYGATVPIRSRGPREAARRGAVAAIIRSVATGDHRFPHTGGTRYTEKDRVTLAVQPIPAAALAVPDADLLARELASGEPVHFRLRLAARTLPDARSANVIGELRGRERPEEIVLLGGHLDSWDLGTGAIDDGVGCAIVVAAARQIARLPERPRRTLRVVLFANEEFGLSGALAYGREHEAEMARHAIGIEADLGGDRVWSFATRVAPGQAELFRPLAELLAPLGIDYAGNDAHGGADLTPLGRALVPIADLPQDATRYFDYHHSADDTVDKIDPEALAQNVAAYATFAWWAAEMPQTLERAPEPAAEE